jgi:hypothetical protein
MLPKEKLGEALAAWVGLSIEQHVLVSTPGGVAPVRLDLICIHVSVLHVSHYNKTHFVTLELKAATMPHIREV